MYSFPNLETFTEVFKQYPEIRAVYLFGSVATDKQRADSDLDLAILARDDTAHTHKLDILADLVNHGFEHVDLVFLNTADTITQYEAVRMNKLIYSTDDFDRGYYYSKIVRKYLDLVPYLNLQRKAYKQRLLRGQA